MPGETYATVDEYIDSFPQDTQTVLQEVRRTVRKVVPAAGELISYKIPTMTLEGRYLVYFAGWKKHISVYPLPHGDDALTREIAPYRASRGTVKFSLDRPVPYDLIERIVVALVEERKSSR